MKVFSVIRNKKDGDKSQVGYLIDGVVFDDGTVVIRWRSETPSTSFFSSFEEFDKIHGDQGHPEYYSEIIWHDIKVGGIIRIIED